MLIAPKQKNLASRKIGSLCGGRRLPAPTLLFCMLLPGRPPQTRPLAAPAPPHAWEAIRNGLKYKSLPLRLPRVRGSWRGQRPRLRGPPRRQYPNTNNAGAGSRRPPHGTLSFVTQSSFVLVRSTTEGIPVTYHFSLSHRMGCALQAVSSHLSGTL